MEALSIYDLFSPRHTAWLHRQYAKKLEVTKDDLDSIEAAFPRATLDPLFAEYRARSDAGTLRRRPGRKARSIPVYLRLWAARFEIEDEMQSIWDKRRSGDVPRIRSDFEPCFQAAETVARRFRLPCTGQTLLKRLYKERIY